MATTDIPATAVTDSHPLEPLSAEEMTQVAELLRRDGVLREGVIVIEMTLDEPDKETVSAYTPGTPVQRRADVVLRDHPGRATVEARVSLTDGTVATKVAEGVQPGFTFEEVFGAIEAIRNDPRWQEAMRRRGISDFELATIDPWPPGYNEPEDDPSRRLVRGLTWIRSTEQDNGYARPIEGLLVMVDIDTLEVVEVEDHGAVPIPAKSGNYWPEAITSAGNFPQFPAVRDDLRPIEITQPEGPSFTVDGHDVTWHKWRFRIGFTRREGLVLHTVAFDDRGRWRPVLHRASLAEMVVPYGDPNPTHWRKNAFDEGEAGFGWLANALELGCDCLGEIHYFDAVVSDGSGEPQTLSNAICMHEEDFGLAWKHFDFQTGRTEVRRRRRLVVSQISTIGNYEYGMYWYFYEDGAIELDMKSTGIVSTGAVAPEGKLEFGTLIAPGLYAPNHQHFFCFRLDMSVDGVTNSVYEVAAEAAAPHENPHGNAWRSKETLLARESEAQRLIDPLTARHWKVVNPDVVNALGQQVGYRLLMAANAVPLFTQDSAISRRAGFATRHLWVTPFDSAERYAAGRYPYQHPGGDGLPAYTAADRSLERTNLVLWPVISMHHPPRPEDWPVMPVTSTGFMLQPVGFFDGNPALDLARPEHNGACHDHHG
jgi:primary-amine oxidase